LDNKVLIYSAAFIRLVQRVSLNATNYLQSEHLESSSS